MNTRITLGIQYVGFAIVLSALAWVTQNSEFTAWAETPTDEKKSFNSTTVIGDEIKNNPTAQKILKNIEIAKQRMEQMQQKQKQLTEQQKLVEEQRKIAKEKLEKDLARMNKNYEDFIPKNAYFRFLSNNVNATHYDIFWDQFNYMAERMIIASQAKKAILDNGGTYAEARAEFNKYASMTRVDMIKYVQEINIKHGFTDESLQSYFDKNGKLPRYDDDEISPCYGCVKYEKIKDEILEEKLAQNSTKTV